MVEYILFTENKYSSGCGFYITYGIIVFEDNVHIRTVKDISADKEKVKKLIDSFNENELSPIHLSQAVEEFLYDFSVD